MSDRRLWLEEPCPACGTLLDGGRPSHQRATSSGPLCPALTFCWREVVVEEYAPAACRSQVAWHADWREREYDVLGEQLRADSPKLGTRATLLELG